MCGERLFGQHVAAEAAPLCGLCRQSAPHFHKAVAYGAYEGSLRDLIHLLKYQGIRPAARTLGRLVSRAMARTPIEGSGLLVVPVPLASAKRRARGFNQAEEIARAFCRERDQSGIQMDAALLIRKRETVSQTGLTREQRRANLSGAFAVAHRERLRDRTVLVVDDVMTTGATAGECARVLLGAGAKQVFVATVARATRGMESGLAQAAGAIGGGTTGHA